jgi:hypothetical protein
MQKIPNKVTLLNPSLEPLSIAKLKTFNSYENLDESEIKTQLDAIEKLAQVLYETVKYMQESKIYLIDNQLSVNLDTGIDNQSPVIDIFQNNKLKAA